MKLEAWAISIGVFLVILVLPRSVFTALFWLVVIAVISGGLVLALV